MRIELVEGWTRRAGALMMAVTLASILSGLVKALRRPGGRATGHAKRVLRGPFYLGLGLPYFAFCFVLWRPFARALPTSVRAAALLVGALLYFPGLALVLWGRLTLGRMYNVSSGFGVQLYSGHRLVTHGSYAHVRHPMYLGLLLATLGGTLLYRTWTLVFLLANAATVLIVRGRREDQALAAEFGAEWQAYRRRVPYFIPRSSKANL